MSRVNICILNPNKGALLEFSFVATPSLSLGGAEDRPKKTTMYQYVASSAETTNKEIERVSKDSLLPAF
jgi:hypothetical protein